jgi:hypothetical protein
MSEKIRSRAASVIVIIMIGAFAFGLLRFFGAPVFECALGDCGKASAPPAADFAHQFVTWQTIVFVVWSVGLFSLWLLRSNRNKR